MRINLKPWFSYIRKNNLYDTIELTTPELNVFRGDLFGILYRRGVPIEYISTTLIFNNVDIHDTTQSLGRIMIPRFTDIIRVVGPLT